MRISDSIDLKEQKMYEKKLARKNLTEAQEENRKQKKQKTEEELDARVTEDNMEEHMFIQEDLQPEAEAQKPKSTSLSDFMKRRSTVGSSGSHCTSHILHSHYTCCSSLHP